MQDHYRPQPVAANGSYTIHAPHMFGFLASVVGTITVTTREPTPQTVVNAMPVVLGFNRIPLLFPTPDGADVQLAGGAAGSLLL